MEDYKAKAEKDFRCVEKIWLLVAVLLTSIHFAIHDYFLNRLKKQISIIKIIEVLTLKVYEEQESVLR